MHKKTPVTLLFAAICSFVFCQPPACGETPNEPPQKELILPGEVFSVEGRTAFLFTPANRPDDSAAPAAGPKPWILYSPKLPCCPDKAEEWRHEQFTRAGIAVAGIDTGESYGSPAAVKAAESLHAELVRRGYATKPAVLGRSRGPGAQFLGRLLPLSGTGRFPDRPGPCRRWLRPLTAPLQHGVG